MKNENIVIAVTRLEEQITVVNKTIKSNHTETMKLLKRNEGRITSLEHSRTGAKVILSLMAAALTFIGWDSLANWIK